MTLFIDGAVKHYLFIHSLWMVHNRDLDLDCIYASKIHSHISGLHSSGSAQLFRTKRQINYRKYHVLITDITDGIEHNKRLEPGGFLERRPFNLIGILTLMVLIFTLLIIKS